MSGSGEPVGGQRIDRWLWFARFLKSRTLAAALVASGKMRVNGERVVKASRLVRPGDVLTFPLGPHIRVIEVVSSGTRRGPAAEARGLYADLAPPAPLAATETSTAAREPGSGRPTKKDRRRTDALKDGP
ncbi:MAG TPA: RNA-binding S4 domain-containing protein [Parvibaculum sp.]|uniref:RNA-binding S4 domain-containing protein n=1 Tax=Parvibaculum sp. TaxID=2024848 RepID=UPI002C7A5C0B|nr:RNA-binding S4 domain-containing protein [Parvibaculum sp.]HMM15859.1 RNA-binding S4 domain-containing protein [Parvibaculum sp.]